MIVYDLACGMGHRFEGWFASADDFSAQKQRELLSCPRCGSPAIERVPSATRINVIGAEPAPSPQPAAAPQAAPEATTPQNPLAQAHALYTRFVEEIVRKTEDVGREFPSEARKIFYEEAPARPIRGVASQEEHDALVDEGIPVARLPVPPGGMN